MRYITLSEHLRPWAQLGITHFLSEHDSVTSSFEESTSFNDDSSSSVLSLKPKEAPLDVNDPSFKDTHVSAPCINDINKEIREAQFPPLMGVDAPFHRGENISTSYTLPSHWKTQLSKVSQASVVWSYPELGLDLNGQPAQERSTTLKALIGMLSLPRGTNAFWPMALPNEQGSLVVDIEAYLFGLEKINPQVVLLLGENTVSHLSRTIKLMVPYTQQMFEGRLYIFLPDLLSIHSERSSLEKTHLYLKTVFATLQFSLS